MIMFAIPIIGLLEDNLTSTLGNSTILGMIVLFFFAVAFMFAGIDFRLSGLLIMPIIIAMGSIGWLPVWVVGLSWIILVGFSLYLIWNYMRER